VTYLDANGNATTKELAPWTPATTDTFNTVNSPVIDTYVLLDSNQKTITGERVAATDNDIAHKVVYKKAGSIKPQIPAGVTPLTPATDTPYSNNPQDPSGVLKPDPTKPTDPTQPNGPTTPVIPEVTGYTPYGPNGKPLEKDPNGGYKVPDLPTDPTQDTPIVYVKNGEQLAITKFVDVNGNEGTVDAKYLYKQYDVNGVEAFKKRIVNDIHKYTNTPDLTDTNFSGIQSGEAMKYKLFGLEQARVDTQSLFEKSLRRRYQLIANIGDYVKELSEFNIAKLKITFNPNLPKALEETINAFKSLGGMVTNETAMRLTGIVDDPKHEQELLDTPTITLDNSYDLDKGKLMYKISSILKKFKSGDYSEALARKFLKDLGLSEEDIESYLHDGEEVLIDEETII